MSFIVAGCALLLALFAGIILDDTGGSPAPRLRQPNDLAFPRGGNPSGG